MTEIKRPNYFTAQFLVEKDFKDEQAYHLTLRRRHNRVSQTSGVADGLGVTLPTTNSTQVQIATGTAIDKDGNEIVINDPITYSLVNHPANLDVFLTIGYREVQDPADAYAPAPEHTTRTTERPLIQDGVAVPPTDGSVIVLAKIHLNVNGQIQSGASIDTSVRTISSAKLGPAVVTATQIANGAVGNNQLGPLAVTGPKIAANTVTGGAGGNLAAATVTGGAGGNLAAGTVTGGTGGNLAAATVTGGAGGNLANTTITNANIVAGTVTGGAGGNLAAGTVTGGTGGNLANTTITNANIAAGTIGVAQLTTVTPTTISKSDSVPAAVVGPPLVPGTLTIPVRNDADPTSLHYHVLFSAIVTTAGQTITWREQSIFLGTQHQRQIVVTNNAATAVSFDWKIVLIPM